MIELFRPAPARELAEMTARLTPPIVLAKAGGPWGLAMVHLARTRSWGAYEGERCLACGGLWAERPGELEAWFACAPEAAAHMLGIVRAIRLTLSAIAETERVEIRARVAEGWRPGERLARACGFRLERRIAGTEIWLMRRGL